MFTDATRVVINNKEVQSITTSNGGVIYNAYEPYTCLIQTDGSRQLTITNLTTGNPVTITDNQCQLNVGNNYQFQAIHPKGDVDTFEELVTYQGEGYYLLIINKGGRSLTFYEGAFNGITVTTDKSIIQTGETSNITVQVKENGFPANQKTVNIYKMED